MPCVHALYCATARRPTPCPSVRQLDTSLLAQLITYPHWLHWPPSLWYGIAEYSGRAAGSVAHAIGSTKATPALDRSKACHSTSFTGTKHLSALICSNLRRRHLHADPTSSLALQQPGPISLSSQPPCSPLDSFASPLPACHAVSPSVQRTRPWGSAPAIRNALHVVQRGSSRALPAR